MTAAGETLEADLTWTGEGFERGVVVAVGDDGRIASVIRRQPGGPETSPPRRLAGRALLPGFVDVHSHAFQRGLRGRGETFPAGAGSFWTWREAMYGLVERLDLAEFRALCLQCFREMRAAGITSLGEFHYFRHGKEREDFACDELVLEAAQEAGLRLVLLGTYYRTGGIGQPLAGGQRRFATPSPAVYWEQMDRLAGQLRSPLQSLGAVVHSIRAASLDDLVAVHEEAERRGLVFHMHVEEQRKEIADCRAAYGQTPLALVNERLAVSERFTAIHCTHSAPLDMDRFGAAGGNVCLCPLTEANLGDGIADVARMRAAGAGLCLGSDSNVRLSWLEEMRWLEFVQRLGNESRGLLRDGEGQVARTAFRAATEGGARALGLPVGRIAAGGWADFVAIDLEASCLLGWTDETLLDALVFGGGDEAIAATSVGGEWQERAE
ncbi:MAG TPA: formimidoylglutamate deiminase [Thermoanaerobaculia bacterium]|nr:formimidoylglutamate deiminase [Thermoanaerobaculia bacterium]